jgi:lipoprotein-anchoring transpeptidase ErfK/SrfK
LSPYWRHQQRAAFMSADEYTSIPMQRFFIPTLIAAALGSPPAYGQLMPVGPAAGAYAAQPTRVAAAPQQRGGNMGGGFIEMLFGDGQPTRPAYARPDARRAAIDPEWATSQRYEMNPVYQRQVINYDGPEHAGTIIIDTPNRFLFLVQENGKALRYGIGVGRPGFTWAGVKAVTAKREWPDWRPPEEMLKRRPDLPRYMAGGPDNPLGARAMYLGNTLYRIHGSNEPWTIGTQVSSGCIRMRNEDVIDLYERVKLGSKVVVI